MAEEARTSDRTIKKVTCNFKVSRVECRPRRGSVVENEWIVGTRRSPKVEIVEGT